MVEIAKDVMDEPERRTPSSEYVQPSRALLDLKDLSIDQLKSNWENLYREEYLQADILREKGYHDQALILFKQAQDILNYVVSCGIKSETLSIRELHCSYMIIQCYTNLQRRPDAVMRELYNISAILIEMLRPIVGNDLNITARLNGEYRENNHIKIQTIYDCLYGFYKKNEKNLNHDNLVLIWRCAYYITRYSGIAHDFFLRSTSHVSYVKALDKITKDATQLTRETFKKIPAEVIENDPTGINHNVKMLQEWLEIYDDVLSADIALIFGDHDMSLLHFHGDIISKLKNKIGAFVRGNANQIDKRDFEHSMELLANAFFTYSCVSEENFLKYKNEFDELFELSEKHGCKRVSLLIKLFYSRAALRYKRTGEATSAYQEAFLIRERDNETKPATPQLIDMWLDILNAEIQLNNFENIDKSEKTAETIGDAVTHIIGIIEEEPDYRKKYKFQLTTLENIEKSFAEYTDSTNDVTGEKPRLGSLPLLARIHYLLGLTAFKKAEIFGKAYKNNDRDIETGELLLEAFKNTRRHLCYAYSILLNMNMSEEDPDLKGYKDQTFFNEIHQIYRDMLSLNYSLSGLDKDDQLNIIPGEKQMPDIVKHWQLQNWTDIVFALIKERDVFASGDFMFYLSSALQKSLKNLIPSVSRVEIAGHNEKLQSGSDDLKVKYYYNTPKGKIIISKFLDDSRELMVETAISFTEHEKELLNDISNGVRILLKIFDSRKNLDVYSENEAPPAMKEELLKNVFALFKNLFRKHPPTVTHSEKMAEFVEVIVEKVLEQRPESDIDPVQIKYAALLHDIGKLYLDPQLILDKRSKLLPVEMKDVEKHAVTGPEILMNLLGLKFKNLIALTASHHVMYSDEGGYPVRLPSQSIKAILPELIPKFLRLTAEQKEAFKTAILNEDYQDFAHIFNIIDQVQALTAKDRAYRKPMPLSELYGYLRRQSGLAFDPYMVNLVIGIIREGHLDHLFYHYDDFDEVLKSFELVKIYNRDQIIVFFEEKREQLNNILRIDIDEFITILKRGEGKNLTMSPQCLGWGICDLYIKQSANDWEHKLSPVKKLNPVLYRNAIRQAGTDEYKKDRQGFFDLFYESMPVFDM